MSASPVAKKLKMDSTATKKIGTHSGTFHADEALAVYMLKQLPRFAEAEVVRSRNMEVLEECDVVVDVSGKYDGVKFFDHHQREFNDVYGGEFQTKLSSAGLVYKHFGREVVSAILKEDEASDVVEAIHLKVYKDFVEAIDANDNGINVYDVDALKQNNISNKFVNTNITLPAVVSKLNPLPEEVEGPNGGDALFDSQFKIASELMGSAFKGVVVNLARGWFPAKQAVAAAFDARTKYDAKGRIIVFEKSIFWKSHLYAIEEAQSAGSGLEQVLYVIYPGGPNDWRVQAVGLTQSSFESRKALPEPWRGVRDQALSDLTGVPDCVFIHAAGFIGGNKTREGALALAKLAVDF